MGESGLYTDPLGHASNILKNLSALNWLTVLYDVDLANSHLKLDYTSDLKQIAGKRIAGWVLADLDIINAVDHRNGLFFGPECSSGGRYIINSEFHIDIAVYRMAYSIGQIPLIINLLGNLTKTFDR